jgi:hypothetical protein
MRRSPQPRALLPTCALACAALTLHARTDTSHGRCAHACAATTSLQPAAPSQCQKQSTPAPKLAALQSYVPACMHACMRCSLACRQACMRCSLACRQACMRTWKMSVSTCVDVAKLPAACCSADAPCGSSSGRRSMHLTMSLVLLVHTCTQAQVARRVAAGAHVAQGSPVVRTEAAGRQRRKSGYRSAAARTCTAGRQRRKP